MAEIIKLNKRLPNLSPEEEQVFTEAISEAYLRGKADAKPKWIPVTERLPEKDGKYLVCKTQWRLMWQEVLDFAKDGRKIHKYDFCDRWKNVWYYYDSECGYVTTDSVIYWMPLPEPPKGE